MSAELEDRTPVSTGAPSPKAAGNPETEPAPEPGLSVVFDSETTAAPAEHEASHGVDFGITSDQGTELPPPPVARILPIVTRIAPHEPVRPDVVPTPPAGESDAGATEVHVHIGRIEVTAARDPVPAKRPRKTARQPRSLDDYLGERSRRPG